MLQTYKHEITLALGILGLGLAFYYLYSILLPFLIGLMLVFAVMPLIRRLQKRIKNPDLAKAVFLLLVTTILVLLLMFTTRYINRDFQRMNQSFSMLIEQNQDQLNATTQKVKDYLGSLYDIEELENQLRTQADSLSQVVKTQDVSSLDTESIEAAYEKLLSFLPSGVEPEIEKQSGPGFLYLLFSSIFYFVFILFQFDYFDGLRKRYASSKGESSFALLWQDFDQSFLRYFRLRSRIVFALSPLYFLAFWVLDMPGMILITILIIFLSYIPYLQYLALIPLAIGCLVLAIEHQQNFFLFFGIVVGVFILANIIEELLLVPRIMERNIGMNPVIMALSISVWSYLLGFSGLLIGIPLTGLLIIYIKRYFIPSYSHLLKDDAQNE